jgi:hypothetical protein
MTDNAGDPSVLQREIDRRRDLKMGRIGLDLATAVHCALEAGLSADETREKVEQALRWAESDYRKLELQ